MDMYNQLIDIGLTQNEIDNMDMVYHLQLLGRRKQEKEGANDDGLLYIDDIPGM